jgi:hypothetical protein
MDLAQILRQASAGDLERHGRLGRTAALVTDRNHALSQFMLLQSEQQA